MVRSTYEGGSTSIGSWNRWTPTLGADNEAPTQYGSDGSQSSVEISLKELLCHAAIVARKFSLPAVIGATGATSQIPDGALVEVDPVAGRVRTVG